MKVLFWSSPYACHSESTSCTHTAGDKFFDFTPLQANPGEKAWKTQHRSVFISRGRGAPLLLAML